MPVLLSEVYDAFLEAGASEAKARAAAAAVAQSDTRFTAIDGRLTRIESRLDRVEERLNETATKADLARLEARVTGMDTRMEQMRLSGETRFAGFEAANDARFARMETRLMRWMLAGAALGGLAGGIVAVVARLVKFI